MQWSEFYDTAGRLAKGTTDFQIVLAALLLRDQLSVSITMPYRAIYVSDGDTNVWYWIGSHGEYDILSQTSALECRVPMTLRGSGRLR